MSEAIVLEVEVSSPVVEIEVTPTPAAIVTPQLTSVIYAATPGIQGVGGSGASVVGESLTGIKDASNIVFTTAQPFRSGTTAVYLNGIREFFYSETGANQITLQDAPHSGDSLHIDYAI